MTTIPAGGVFAVLEGPICTDNGIAWWKVNSNGIIGYTAEGQATVYWLEPYTGAPPPPSGSFGIVGVTAAVSPSSSISCPQTFAFTGQIVVNIGGTVTYKWERSDGTSSSTQSFTFGAGGSQTFTDNWTVTSNFGGWERLHVLTPNDVTSNQANITLACGAVAFHVTSVSVSVDYPNSICPGPPPGGQVFTFTGQINVNAAGSVTYKWERSDGALSSPLTVTASGPGTLGVHTTWTLGAHSYTGWERIHVTSPNDITSNKATFNTCP